MSKLKFRLREFTSCLCSAVDLAVCFEGRLAGLDATETGHEGKGDLDITEFDITESDITNFQEFDITEFDITEKGN